jgi:hypothetical protein
MADPFTEALRNARTPNPADAITPPEAAPQGTSFESALEALRSGQAATPEPPPNPADYQRALEERKLNQEENPGFGEKFMRQVRPLLHPIDTAGQIWEASKAVDRERAEYAKTHPGFWEQQKHKAKQIGIGISDAAKALVVDLPAEVYWDAKRGRWASAAGTIAGFAAPMVVGGALKAVIPKIPIPPKIAAAGRAAEEAYTAARSKLPAVTTEAAQKTAATTTRRASAQIYSQWQNLRKRARDIAQRHYKEYDEVLNHPANEAPAGFKLREELLDPDGNVIKPAVIADAPVKSPVPTAPYVKELEELIDADRNGIFPAGHPIKEFLKAIDNTIVRDVEGNIVSVTKGGLDYIPHQDLKNALGELAVYADSAGLPSDPFKRLAIQIRSKAKPILEAQVVDLADKAGVTDIPGFLKKLDKANQQWASAVAPFKKMAPAIGAAKVSYTEQFSATGKVPKGLPGRKPSSIKGVVEELPQTRVKAARAKQMLKAAEEKSHEDWTHFLTANTTNLRNYLEIAGPDKAPEVLAHVLDYAKKTKNYKFFTNLKPEVMDELTAHAPGLGPEITRAFTKLTQAQELYGAGATQGALARAANATLRFLEHPAIKATINPHATANRMQGITELFSNRNSAQILNTKIESELSKLMRKSGKVLKAGARAGVRVGATGAQVVPGIAANAPMIPPPPTEPKMAGE